RISERSCRPCGSRIRLLSPRSGHETNSGRPLHLVNVDWWAKWSRNRDRVTVICLWAESHLAKSYSLGLRVHASMGTSVFRIGNSPCRLELSDEGAWKPWCRGGQSSPF